MMAILMIVTSIFCQHANAQAPQGIPYQAVARDNAGNLIKNQSISLRFSIHDGTETGTVVYSETHSVTTDALGLFSVNIGGGASSISFANINWGSGSKFTQVELDVTGGSNYINMGTTKMMSVPYALYAGSTGSLTVGEVTYPNTHGAAGQVLSTNGSGTLVWVSGMPAGTAAGQMLYWNGTAWVTVAPGTPGLQGNQVQTLKYCNGVPIWGECPAGLPTLTTSAINGITDVSATSGGSISNDGGATVTLRGLCWSTSSNPTVALSTKTTDGNGMGSYSSSIAGLAPGTTYYVRAYATNSAGTGYGDEVVFNSADGPPILSTTAISGTTLISANSGGFISNGGGVPVTARGVCWSTSSNPTISLTTKTVDGTGVGAFTSSITGLTQNTTYYVRSYASNIVGTGYGQEVEFTSLPISSTSSVSDIMAFTATCGGNISTGGNATITARGVCWSTSSNPTIALSTKTVDGTGIGSFTSSITGLTDNTTYYVRSYATNAGGTVYGQEVVFTTLPISSTSSVSDIMAFTATCGGNTSTGGNATIISRGVCWSTSSNPTIALTTKTFDGTGIGSFTSSITGLRSNTTYYVRSYATNASGTAYGQEVVFRTPPEFTTQNLNVSTYSDGTPIPKVTNNATWSSLTTGAYCYYENDSATYAAVYGKLYNWYAVAGIYDAASLSNPSLRKSLAPVGYHIPTNDDWTNLINYLGGMFVAGGKMKEVGTTYWLTPNTGATNSSGFTGLPGGCRIGGGSFYDIGAYGIWWSSTEFTTSNSWARYLLYSTNSTDRYNTTKTTGVSVRCVKD